MAKFHVNPNGEASVCRAQQGGCPFGGEDVHYSSLKEARQGYERRMEASRAGGPLQALTKKLKRSVGIPEKEKPPYPEFKADGTAKMVDLIERASNLASPIEELERAEFRVFLERGKSGEEDFIPASFKRFYTDENLLRANLNLANWTPSSNTQKFIVHELLGGALSQHYQGLKNAGLRRDTFSETLNGLTEGGVQGLPKFQSDLESGKIDEFDQGWIYGYLEAAEHAKEVSFPESSSYAEQMRHLYSFIESRESAYAASWSLRSEEEISVFEEGKRDSHYAWLQEDLDWEVPAGTPLYE